MTSMISLFLAIAFQSICHCLGRFEVKLHLDTKSFKTDFGSMLSSQFLQCSSEFSSPEII